VQRLSEGWLWNWRKLEVRCLRAAGRQHCSAGGKYAESEVPSRNQMRHWAFLFL